MKYHEVFSLQESVQYFKIFSLWRTAFVKSRSFTFIAFFFLYCLLYWKIYSMRFYSPLCFGNEYFIAYVFLSPALLISVLGWTLPPPPLLSNAPQCPGQHFLFISWIHVSDCSFCGGKGAKRELILMAAGWFSRKGQEGLTITVFSTSCMLQEGWMLSPFCMAADAYTRACNCGSPWVPLS